MFLLSCRSSVNTFDLKNEVFCCVKSLNSWEHINLTGCSPIIWLECTVYPDPILVFFFFCHHCGHSPTSCLVSWIKPQWQRPGFNWLRRGGGWGRLGRLRENPAATQRWSKVCMTWVTVTLTSCPQLSLPAEHRAGSEEKTEKKKKKSTAASGTEMWNCNVTSKRRGKISQRNHTNYNHYRCGKVQ